MGFIAAVEWSIRWLEGLRFNPSSESSESKPSRGQTDALEWKRRSVISTSASMSGDHERTSSARTECQRVSSLSASYESMSRST